MKRELENPIFQRDKIEKWNNISLDEETAAKLEELADSSHKNMSQWITDKIWETAEKVKDNRPKTDN